jgi:hypothetical protein
VVDHRMAATTGSDLIDSFHARFYLAPAIGARRPMKFRPNLTHR